VSRRLGTIRWHVVVRQVTVAAWTLAGLRALYFLSSIPNWRWSIGIDQMTVVNAAREWLSGGSFYLPHTLEGPFTIHGGEILYPPVLLWVLAPFALLPALGFLYWVIPLVATAAAIRRMRPRPIAWLLIGVLAMTPVVQGPVFWGNPVIWLVPAIAWAMLKGWPAVFVLVKPSLAPLALLGIRSRSWWVALAALAALSLPFGDLWLTWLGVIGNLRVGPFYSAPQLALLAIPIVAWLASPSGERRLVAISSSIRTMLTMRTRWPDRHVPRAPGSAA
jgi:hypothetical protein